VVAINQDPAQVVGWLHSSSSANQVWVKPLGSTTGPEWAVIIANLTSTSNTSQITYFSLTNIPNAGRIMWWKELWSGTTNFATDGLLVTNWPCESKLFRLTPYTAGPTFPPGIVPYSLLSTTNTPSAGQVLKFDGTNMYWASP
jgi:hypothetical protein